MIRCSPGRLCHRVDDAESVRATVGVVRRRKIKSGPHLDLERETSALEVVVFSPEAGFSAVDRHGDGRDGSWVGKTVEAGVVQGFGVGTT
jgi:hypothetical protein